MKAGPGASPARVIATRVLHRIAVDEAWASPTLDAELAHEGIDPRDAGLATEITYGTLRTLVRLDRQIDALLSRGPSSLEPFARAALRAAAYQIAHLSRVPPHAVVSDAVTIVREARGEGLARLVNAIGRKLSAARPEAPGPARGIELPAWLDVLLRDALGESRATEFIAARTLPPPLGLRVATTRIERDALAERIRAARPSATITLGAVSDRALLVRGAGEPRALPGFREGLFSIQEEGAQRVALLCGVVPGERVVDACAGRGGKTSLFAELVGDAGSVLAIDLHEPKLDQIALELARLEISASRLTTRTIDLSVGAGGLDGTFDRVVVDAPCTGLGTVHRRPELLLRIRPVDPARLAALQLRILATAAALVRPGGVLVYAVCSPTREEGIAVVEKLEQAHPRFERVPDEGADADGITRIGPWTTPDDGPDAYQLARWRSR